MPVTKMIGNGLLRRPVSTRTQSIGGDSNAKGFFGGDEVSIQFSLDETVEFDQRIYLNQRRLRSEIKTEYDFIVCGSGPSGSVVARRLAENPDVTVLLLESGSGDDLPEVMRAGEWPMKLSGGTCSKCYAQPKPRLNGRSLPLNVGPVLDASSPANSRVWARGHKNDWDFFAAEAGDTSWNYDSVLAIYRRIENWQGTPDPKRRGTGGLLSVQPAQDTNPIAPAMIAGAKSIGLQIFDDVNGSMMEGDGGAALNNMLVGDGDDLPLFRTYVHPVMVCPNLTVLRRAIILRVIFEGKRAVGVEVSWGGLIRRIHASIETILSLGSISTPTLLMQSGVGDENELRQFGVPVVEHLPGVGKNFQDHVFVASCVWEPEKCIGRENRGGVASFFWKSDSGLDTPNIQVTEFPLAKPVNEGARATGGAWGMCAGLVRPGSHGQIHLTGPNPLDAVRIDSNNLYEEDDLRALIKAFELCRDISESDGLRRFTKRDIPTDALKGVALENFIRDGIATVRHQAGTAKMGQDRMSVVDHNLKVYGIDNLRIADGSIMPRVTTGNPMAPCVVIGERAAEVVRAEYRL